MPQVAVQEVKSLLTSLIRGHHSRMQLSRSPARDFWKRHDQTYNHLYQHPTIAHHPHGGQTSRPEAPMPPLAQSSTHKDRVVHMINHNQSYERYTSLKVPLGKVYKTIKDQGLLYLIPQ